MPAKRGRPISNESQDPVVLERLQRRAERNRRYYNSHRPPRRPPTQAQLQQGEQIVSLAITDEEEAAVTLSQMGLRVSGLTLAQDAEDAQLQQGAAVVDEHRTLYGPHALTTARNYHPSLSYSSPRLAQPQSSQP